MLVPFPNAAYTRSIALILVALLLVVPASASAAPSNAKIRAARARAVEARVKLADLNADLEVRTEDYFEVESELEATRKRISEAEAELEVAQVELDAAEVKLNGRASAIYRNGPVDLVSVLVGATNFRDFVTRLDLMRRVGRNDANLVGDVKQARGRIEDTRSALERRRAEQTVLRDQARERKTQMDEAVAAQKQYLSQIDSTLKKLIAEEEARLERIAREQAAEAARIAASKGVGRAGRDFDPNALDAPHAQVVELARAYVGKTPYVWGGTSPSGFDCSGLVQYCYRQIGLELPRTSRTQYHVGAYIPPSRLDLLQPGDLVFFGRDGDPGRIHHVAIYSGGGMMVHAPQTGEMVSETSLMARIAERGDYVGGVRP